MKRKEFVLVYDSGIGGLTTLSTIIKTSPNLNYIYFADTKNCPYGNKCKTKLKELITHNIKTLLNKYTISHVVLACNTATTSSIEHLRKVLNIPIIGTEPNIKSPIKLGHKNILVLATPLTITTQRLIHLEQSSNVIYKNKGIKALAKLIENYKLNQDNEDLNKIKSIIDQTLQNTKHSTAIVLGCTHFIYMKRYIEEKGYTCFDGNQGVANRLKAITNQPLSKNHKPIIHIITSNSHTNIKYKQILKGLLNRNK